MVMVFDAHVADTPAGNPFAPDTPLFDIPVAPVVTIVILANAVLIHNVGVDDGAPNVLFGVTVSTAGFEIVCGQVPLVLLITTSYVPPSLAATPVMVSLAVVAP